MASPFTASQAPGGRQWKERTVNSTKTNHSHTKVCACMCVCVCVCVFTCLIESLLEDRHDPSIVSRTNIHDNVPPTAEGNSKLSNAHTHACIHTHKHTDKPDSCDYLCNQTSDVQVARDVCVANVSP